MTENPPDHGDRPDGTDRPDDAADPARMDPEQWRQFQEFQRFQEYLRFTESRSNSGGTELAQWTPTQVPVPDQPREAVPYQQPGQDDPAADAPTPPRGLPTAPPTQAEPHAQAGLQQQLTGMQQQLTEISKTQRAVERRVNPPLWRRLLRSNWVRFAILVLVLLTGLGPWLLSQLLGNDSSPQDEQAALSPLRRAEKSFLDPEDAVPFVYYIVAGLAQDRENVAGAERFCVKAFNSRAAEQFARIAGNTGDCASAAVAISAKVTDPGAYRQPAVPNMRPEQLTSGTTTVSSCDLPIKGGPRLGAFTLKRYQDTGRWEISAVRAESC